MEFDDFNVSNVSPSLVYIDFAQQIILWPQIADIWPAYSNLCIYDPIQNSENVITTIDISYRVKGTLTVTPEYDGQIDAFIVCEDTDWTMFLLRYS